MKNESFGDRHKAYEQAYESQIIKRIPVIIRVDGRSFHKVTKKIQRPYCPRMLSLMSTTLIESIKQIDGAVFGYQQSDEITFVVRNDQTLDTDPWFGNRVQKIASITAALVTYEFNKHLTLMENPPNLKGQALFDARVFGLPNLIEVINNLIWRQQDCIRNAISSAAYAELGKKYGTKNAYKLLQGRSTKEREQMLEDKCGIVFAEKYPKCYRLGYSTYKAPKIIETEQGSVTRYHWMLDSETPRFSEERDFIMSILESSGRDIFRADRDLLIQKSHEPNNQAK